MTDFPQLGQVYRMTIRSKHPMNYLDSQHAHDLLWIADALDNNDQEAVLENQDPNWVVNRTVRNVLRMPDWRQSFKDPWRLMLIVRTRVYEATGRVLTIAVTFHKPRYIEHYGEFDQPGTCYTAAVNGNFLGFIFGCAGNWRYTFNSGDADLREHIFAEHGRSMGYPTWEVCTSALIYNSINTNQYPGMGKRELEWVKGGDLIQLQAAIEFVDPHLLDAQTEKAT